MKFKQLAVAGLTALWSVAVSAQPAAPAWPSVSEQLSRDKVVAGSALEAFVKANQDFSLLRPEESKDLIRVPPWLRVAWRKAHPEDVYPADDPTGGYPFVLKEVHEWMLSHQDLKPGTPEPHFPPPGPKATVGPDLRISGLQTAPRSESDIRINFWDPQKIICASNNIVASGLQGQYYSTDGGATWGQTTLGTFFTGDAFHSDPTVDWTSDGRAWSTTLGINSSGSVLRGRSYLSTDNGATWAQDGTFSGTQSSVDKQFHWVDHRQLKVDGSPNPYYNNQYVIYHNGTPAFVNARPLAGTWGATPLQVSGAESTGTCIGGDIKTNEDGEVFGFWPTTTNRRVFVVKSTNGGASYGAPVQIATTFDGYDIGVPSFNNRRVLIYVSAGAYKTASKNMVYASWSDLSGETGCTAAANEPGSNVASTCKTRIWFSRSTDGGATWSAAAKINDQAGLNDQFNQWLAVDPTTGAIGVMYYDTVGDPGRKKTDVWYQSSFTDGATWNAPVKVTTAQTDETAGGQDSGNQYGDYNSLSGYAGIMFPSWTDRRAGAREEIWTAKITDAACSFPGTLAIGTATVPGANQVQVSWTNGAPASTLYNVYRAVGTCAAPGTFTRIATGLAASPYLDTTVSGGITYAYKVAGTDASGVCESPQSGCVEATATGVCTLAPSFAGLASVTNLTTASCQLRLDWAAATPTCSGPVAYNVYRSTTSGFTPAPANLIASAVSGTTYTDSSPLNYGVTYYYVVRAVDSGNGAEETNAVQRSGVPTGAVALSTLTETFEAVGGFDNPGWAHQAVAGANDWVWSTAQSQTPTHSWFSASLTTATNRVLVSPSFGVNASTALSFWHNYHLEQSSTPTTCFDGGTLEASTDAGATWSTVPGAAITGDPYTGTVSTSFSNPIAGKAAWCNNSALTGWRQVNVNLSGFAGQTIKLRWHEGDDSSVARTGWYVDSVTITNAGVAQPCSPTPVELLDFAAD